MRMPPAPRADRRTHPGTDARRARWREPALLAGGVLTAIAAWFVLVVQAIAFGRTASSAVSWVLLVLATLGAVACMFLAILLATRLVSLRPGHDPRDEIHSPPPPPDVAHTGPPRTSATPAPDYPASRTSDTPPAPVPPQRRPQDDAPTPRPSGHRRAERHRGQEAAPRREGGARRAPKRRRGAPTD
ncbi:hypothetical protein GCM10027425_02480 [Alteromonas gracilis]